MKTAKENQGAGSVDVDALLAAINEISESEVQRTQDDPHHVTIDGRGYHTWRGYPMRYKHYPQLFCMTTNIHEANY